MDRAFHLIEDSASKSFRFSAMLMDSSIRGSFFCGNRRRCNTHLRQIQCFRGFYLLTQMSGYHSFLCVQPSLTEHAALQLLVQGLGSLLGWFHPLFHLSSVSQTHRDIHTHTVDVILFQLTAYLVWCFLKLCQMDSLSIYTFWKKKKPSPAVTSKNDAFLIYE